jgi:hypothetical protein
MELVFQWNAASIRLLEKVGYESIIGRAETLTRSSLGGRTTALVPAVQRRRPIRYTWAPWENP